MCLQIQTEEVMMVSNKYKQLYECRLPAQAVRFHQDPASEAESQGYTGPNIPELLVPMHKAQCLVKASKQHRLKRYHSQTYVNGSKCDLNGTPRETEVRFVCEEGSGDYVARVDEPQSCRYVLTVHTSRTCQHPFLRPPSTAKPQGIVCQPALSAQQYMNYVKAQVSDTKRKVEQISEELRSLDEMLAVSEGRGAPADTATTPEKSPAATDNQGLKARNQAKSEAEKQQRNGVTERSSEKDEEEEERLLQEFAKEVADLSAQQELETEGLKGEFDRSQATQKLETTLDKLLDHLEDKDAQHPEQQQQQQQQQQHLGGGQRANDPTRGSPSLAPHQPDQAADDHIKIKITKYKTGSSPDGQVKVQEMGEGDPQWQHIKDVVKEQLEKAGLKAEGKIEVKILTRKNAEEAGDQWLNEEDFRELLVNLLTGGTEEVHKEQKRQQDLENNYGFVWDNHRRSPRRPPPPTRTTWTSELLGIIHLL
ncbi:hypothetical protein CRUP_005226 [Coryphaenoides rupestris]|nr:hypothetical protein CRUP_005226 [Coryphaenoides rupestris]